MGLITFPSEVNYPDTNDAFLNQDILPSYDHHTSESAVGLGSGRRYGDGYFLMTIDTAGYSLYDDEGTRRAAAIRPWYSKMRQLGAFSLVPIVNGLYPTFPASQGSAVVSTSEINAEGVRITTIKTNRGDIKEDMYVSATVNNALRIFMVYAKPADNQMQLYPSITLKDGDVLNRATVMRCRLSRDNPNSLPAPTVGDAVYPSINLIEAL